MNSTNDLEQYLRMIAGPDPGATLINVRWRVHDHAGNSAGMHQGFLPAASIEPETLMRLAAIGRRTDVYVGVALREFASGGKRAVRGSHLVWCEIDDPAAEQLVNRAPVRPSLRIASGGSGHLHCYWQLDRTYPPDQIEAANRALAAHLSGDPASTDIARILRPPDTFNHKRNPASPVRVLERNLTDRYPLADLIAGLHDPRAKTAAAAARRPLPARPGRYAGTDTAQIDTALKAIAPVDWVRALSGQEPDADGKVRCPVHEDHSPSLHLYHDGAWCFAGCGAVDVFDFAAAKWGMSTKGAEFPRLRTRLAQELLGTPMTGLWARNRAGQSLPAPGATKAKEIGRT